jgi:hypothetical protein
MNTIRYQLTDQQHMADANIIINEQDYITHISADTGLGKSTWVMTALAQQHNVIFAVPQRAQITQLQAKYSDDTEVSFIYGGHREDIEPTRIIVCTYDQIPYVQSLVYAREYLLVIDEVHKLYQAASYRPDAIANLLDSIQERRFAKVVTLSATFTPALVPFKIDAWIEVKGSKTVERHIDLHIHATLAALEDAVLNSVVKSTTPTVIRINSKKDIQAYKTVLESKGIKCLAVNRDVQHSESVQEVLTTESIAAYDAILTTSLLDEAINISDLDINEIMVLDSRIHPAELKQFVGRFRCCNPRIKLYTLHSLFGGKRKAVDDQRRDKLAIAKAAKQLAELLRSECDVAQATRKANVTLRDMFGFEPLRVRRAEIVANEPAIMASLYQDSIRQCYLNTTALESGLEGHFEALSFSITQPSELADPLNDALFDGAYDAVDEAHQERIKSCRYDVECETRRMIEQHGEPVDSLKVLARCRARYTDDSHFAHLFDRWILLSREVFVDIDDAIDAIAQGRERDVWRFHNDVESNIYIRPMLKHLMQLPIGTPLTLDEARALLLKSLSLASKDYPAFKDIVQAANVTGLIVKRNNHFDVSDSFIRKVIRKYTTTPPLRSNNKDKIIFNGVGIFGYRYRLTSLQKAALKPTSNIRRIRRIKPVASPADVGATVIN